MNWEAIGALGEIIGAIAVVITLIYLAMQIRASNREARAATIQSAIRAEMDTIAVLAQHAGTGDKVLKGAQLEEGAELRTGIMLYNLIIAEAEGRSPAGAVSFDCTQQEPRRISACRDPA